MASSDNSLLNPQQQVFGEQGESENNEYYEDTNQRTYTALTNVPICPESVPIQHEQQIVSTNTSYNNHSPSMIYQRQYPIYQIIQQIPTSHQSFLQQQSDVQQSMQMTSATNVSYQPYASLPSNVQHSYTAPQQPPTLTYQSHNFFPPPPRVAMTHVTSTSTPTVNSKRGRVDLSGTSDKELQPQNRPQFRTRIVNSSNLAFKRHRADVQQQNVSVKQPATIDVQQNLDPPYHTTHINEHEQVSQAACRFASTRYPFSPFSVIFTQDVRDTKVVEELIKFAKDTYAFALQTIAYRKAQSGNKECRILIFVENVDSFSFLHNANNWPPTIQGLQYTTKVPSIPPQLSLVLPSVPIHIDWNEFVLEIKEQFDDVVEVIRLRNKAQQPVRAVKIELKSAKSRSEILEAGVISAMHMKFKVVEYYVQAKVLICSNCCGIGHFRKNCSQQNETTCKVCGEKYTILANHQCSGLSKCIHCGDHHNSDDAKCSVIRDYRAALTRNMLSYSQAASTRIGYPKARLSVLDFPPLSQAQKMQPVSTFARTSLSHIEDVISKKFDVLLVKVEDESKKTRETFQEIKDELCRQNEVTEQKIVDLERKVNSLQNVFKEYVRITSEELLNICTAFNEPSTGKSESWKKYWKDRIDIYKAGLQSQVGIDSPSKSRNGT